MAEQPPQLSRRDARREFNLRTYGTNIPNVKQKEAYAQSVASAEKKGAALQAGFTPPTAAATGDLLKRRLELFKGMQDVGREKAAEFAEEAEGLQISKSGFRQALNKIPLAAATTSTTGTTPAATENVIKVPELAGPPASAAIGGSATTPAATPPPLLQRPSSTVIPTALRPVAAIPSAQQLLQESLARTRANAPMTIGGVPVPQYNTTTAPTAPTDYPLPVAATPTPTPVAATPTPAPTPKPAPASLVDTTNAMTDVARARINKPYTERNVEGFTSFDEMGRNVAKAGSGAANYTKNLLRYLQNLPNKTNAATDRLRSSLK